MAPERRTVGRLSAGVSGVVLVLLPAAVRGERKQELLRPRAGTAIFDLQIDIDVLVTRLNQQLDQLLWQQTARLKARGGEADGLTATRLQCVYVAHVCPLVVAHVDVRLRVVLRCGTRPDIDRIADPDVQQPR